MCGRGWGGEKPSEGGEVDPSWEDQCLLNGRLYARYVKSRQKQRLANMFEGILVELVEYIDTSRLRFWLPDLSWCCLT
jgi:hypothetical protein